MKNMRRAIVIGGGPAGFMAALSAAERAEGRLSVEVWDAGVPLATVLRTGGGRCNITNAVESPRGLAVSYPRGGKLLISVFTRFGARETMEWFRSRGLALVVEDDGRVFPASRRASDVRSLLLRLAEAEGIAIREGMVVEAVRCLEGGFAVEAPGTREEFQVVVIATGGDWREKGTGYAIARGLGHSTTPLAPALSGLVAVESWPETCAGLTVSDARIRAVFEDRTVADERGDFVFTHRGISGPLAFKISSRAAFLPFASVAPLLLSISTAPAESEDALDRELSAAFTAHPKQSVFSAVRGAAGVRLPRSLAEAVLAMADIDPHARAGQISRGARRTLARLAAGIPLEIVGTESEGEIVTAGGIVLDEIDPRTMGSRLVPGLFFCGEVLDIDGFTGGFNLQAAWSTGRLAGIGTAEYLMEDR
jgi:predicted Rossmann fold flavoprotein